MHLLPAVRCKESWLVVVTTLALVLYGVLQERVMTKGWGAHQELFPYSSFLVLSNRLLTVTVLIAHSLIAKHSFIPVAPLRSYCLVSASNMVSTLCQYEALKYVSFVAQTLAKTAKALPVVLWGTIVGGKRYSAQQYIHAILITGGCSMFVLGGDITSGSAIKDASWRSYAFGSVLLLTYLAADGWTSTQQEVLFKTHATPVREQLLYTTAFSTLYSLAASIGSGQLLPALSFLQRHPDAAAAVLTLSLASTVIQVCISSVLQRHGALMFALMMTSRQCVSVLLSTVLFGHALSLGQWFGIAIAFSALYHQKTTSSSKDSTKQAARSRLAISSGPKPSHARDSSVAQPLLDSVGQASMVAAVTQSTVAYRGSQAGIHMHSAGTAASATHPTGAVCAAGGQIPTAAAVGTCAGPTGYTAVDVAAATTAAAWKGEARGGRSAAAAAPSPALLGPWRTSLPSGHDPHLVAVPEVEPVPVRAHMDSSNHGQLMSHRHHAGGQHCQYPAGMALKFPGVQPLPVPNVSMAPVVSSQLVPHTSLQLPGDPAVGPGKQQSFDLRTLWSVGTGRVKIDPTTAVAMDHRDK